MAPTKPLNSLPKKGAARNAVTFLELEHVQPMWPCQSFLEQVGLKDEVKGMLKKSGWADFLSLVCEDDVNDSGHFIGSLQDYHDVEEPYIEYSHRGIVRTTTYKDLRKAMKWPSKGVYRDGGMATETALWNALTGTTQSFRPSISKASEIKDPALFYLKFMLARTLFARDNGKDKVKRLELGVLSLLQEGKKVDWASYFIDHVKQLCTDGVIVCGGLVTLVLRRLHPQYTSEGRYVKDWRLASYQEFESGRLIRYRSNGDIIWTYFADKSLVPPRSPTRRGRPKKVRDDGASGSSSMVAHSGAAQSEEGGMSQQVVDDIFHNMRCYMFGALNITRLPAPAGWKPGDAIPPEYMGPH